MHDDTMCYQIPGHGIFDRMACTFDAYDIIDMHDEWARIMCVTAGPARVMSAYAPLPRASFMTEGLTGRRGARFQQVLLQLARGGTRAH